MATVVEVRAATITIDKAETRTNGGQTPSATGNNTITVTKDGAITTTGGSRFTITSPAIFSYTDGNTISNAGRIRTSGRYARGILARNNNAITNKTGASISTEGGGADGIAASDNNTISNAGSISTKGGGAYGIRANNNNTISNAGSISTEGRFAYGILADDNNTIGNAGSISTEGEYAEGIRADNNNTISNAGSISTEGEYAEGVWADNNNTISNAGSISTEGEDAKGIRADNNNTISNAGSIGTKGENAKGIRADDKNKITNSGTIITSGNTAEGIETFSDNKITNEGKITTSGNDAQGISALNNNTLTNKAGAAISTTGANAAGIRAALSRYTDYNSPDNGNNRITNDGDIRTGGVNAAGIQAAGKENTVTNNGSIDTTGEGAAGLLGITVNTTYEDRITGRDDAPLTLRPTGTRFTNNGTINTTGANAPGIRVEDDSEITNSGGINTKGRSAAGIVAGSNNKITNSGTIAVTGPGSAGIRARDNNQLTLSGTVASAQGSALILGNNNTVNHSGSKTLRSTGTNTPAVVLGSNNTLTNTGRIEATGSGANAHAITGDSNNTINNYGVISAKGGKAICFTGRNNTLNLLAGSVLRGDICRGANSRVNITVNTAPAYAVLWEDITARPKSGQGIPFFYNARTRQLATYDPRLLASAAQSLGDVSGNISGLMARPVLASSANTRNLSGRVAAFWLSPFGSRARERDSGPAGLSPEFTHLGLAGGYDVRLAATQLGVLAGYGRGERVFEGEQRFKPGPGVFKGPFAGLYARQDFARFYVHLGLAGGTLKHEHSRLVNDQRGLNGETRAEARTRSWWLAPEARIGWRALDTGLARFEPSFSARYARQSIRAYTETGIRAPAAVGRRTVEMVETRLEMKASREVGPGRLALRLGWQYRNDLNSNRTQVRLLGETRSLRFEPKLGSSVYLGAEAEFELAPGLFFSLNGEAVSGGGYRSLSGMASLYMRF